ncbi:hypothetical protein M5K25_019193 [Dendrobium thyrsiflorum]|uniref:Uncharacterized protein n=1 Tax=Dendrobium thyrsiflorum TaxID=117978 RepID=A0ABD0UL69_DENTH
MDGRFAALEDLMKKMLEDKQKPATSESTGGHGRGENPNPFRGRENPEVEVLEGEVGPLEPLSREEIYECTLACLLQIMADGKETIFIRYKSWIGKSYQSILDALAKSGVLYFVMS